MNWLVKQKIKSSDSLASKSQRKRSQHCVKQDLYLNSQCMCR